VLLVEEPPKAELVKGKIWHETYDMINKNDERIVSGVHTSDYREIFDSYRKNYSKLLRNAIIKNKSALKEFDIKMLDLFKDYWQSFEEEAKERALNLSAFITKHKIYGTELWERLTPKLLSEQYFKSERLKLSGVIDVIEVHEIHDAKTEKISAEKTSEKIYVPIELKTGKYPEKGMWDGHRIQLAAYMLLLEDAGKNVSEAAMKYRGVDKRVLLMNSFLRQEVIDLIKKTSAVLDSFDSPKHVDNKNKCKSCQFKEMCYDSREFEKLLIKAKHGRKSQQPSI